MKIYLMGAELFYVDGQPDGTDVQAWWS